MYHLTTSRLSKGNHNYKVSVLHCTKVTVVARFYCTYYIVYYDFTLLLEVGNRLPHFLQIPYIDSNNVSVLCCVQVNNGVLLPVLMWTVLQ